MSPRYVPVCLAILIAWTWGCTGREPCCGEPGLEPVLGRRTPPNPGAHAELVKDRDPPLGGTATLTFRYDIRRPFDPSDTLAWVAKGHFEPSYSGVFSYVSGESSWVDTLLSFETREHSVVIRAERRGELLIDASVSAISDSVWGAGGSSTICLCVR
jgi:hypothetical protein